MGVTGGCCRLSDDESDIEGMAVIGEDGESLGDEEDEEESAFKDGTPDTADPHRTMCRVSHEMW